MNWLLKKPSKIIELLIIYNRSKHFIDFSIGIDNYIWYKSYKHITKNTEDYDMNISYKFLYKKWFLYNLYPKARVFQCEFENINDHVIITEVNINEINKKKDKINYKKQIYKRGEYEWDDILKKNLKTVTKITLKTKFVINIFPGNDDIQNSIKYLVNKFFDHRYYDLMNIPYVDISNPYHLNDGDLILKGNNVTLIYENKKVYEKKPYISNNYPINLWNNIYPEGQAVKIEFPNIHKYLKKMKENVIERELWVCCSFTSKVLIGKFKKFNIVIIVPYPDFSFNYYMNYDNSGGWFCSWEIDILRNLNKNSQYLPFFYNRLIKVNKEILEMYMPRLEYEDFEKISYSQIYNILLESKYSIYSLSNFKNYNNLREDYDDIVIDSFCDSTCMNMFRLFSKYYYSLIECLSDLDLNKTIFIGNYDEQNEIRDFEKYTGYDECD